MPWAAAGGYRSGLTWDGIRGMPLGGGQPPTFSRPLHFTGRFLVTEARLDAVRWPEALEVTHEGVPPALSRLEGL